VDAPVDPLVEKVDPVTADFVPVRWLDDRQKMEEMTDTWDKVVIDRTEDPLRWVPVPFESAGAPSNTAKARPLRPFYIPFGRSPFQLTPLSPVW
jgi:hypothetical protein